MHYTFDRIKILCERATCLPPLPASVFRLMEITEGGEASSNQISAIIAADPMLCTKLLRAANAGSDFGSLSRITSVPNAVMRLGLRAVRSMAISLGVQAMFTSKNGTCLFEPLCYSRHSILTGLLGRYIFVRAGMINSAAASLSPDEVFAAGVLHDLPVALLAFIAPDAYDNVHMHCKGNLVSIERGFEDLYGGSIRELCIFALRTWGLAEAFELVTQYVDAPLDAPKLGLAIQSIHLASAMADSKIAESNGFASAPWSCPVEVDPFIMESIGIAEEELDMAFATVLGQIEFYLPTKVMSSPVFLKGKRVS